jgi:ribonuclease HI
VVHNAWEESENVYTRAATLFTDRVTVWNRDIFGNLFHRKKRVLARLSGAQKALASHPTPFLWNLERDLLAEYNSILDQEQEFWALKSRVNWLIDGDRNTKFFHISTLVRRRRNKILCLKDGSGYWCSQAHEVEDMVQLFFKSLFQTSHSSSLEAQDFLPTTIINISSADSDALSSPISDDEIKSALFSMKPFKAPGPDGFHAGFYQRCWSIVGESVISVIKNIFSSVSFPAGFNNTLIALVPKCVGPESLTQYRPISLCNSIYKTITKILVCRLRSILPSIVSPIQTAFVPGRQGMDNVVIVQEIVHALSRRKGRVGGMAIKIDLEKAYDRMEWSFIKVVLEHFKFPTSFVNLVMECISSSSVAILLNGAPLDPFFPSRGLKQGDPLSSYIFILCMEFLGFHIMESCAAGEWHPIKAGQSGPKFSHLFFADDLVLFSSATISCAHAIDEVLGKFCHSSGQKVSVSKSRVLFSANVNPSLRSNIEQILNLKETKDLGKYLGIPISSSTVRAKDFDYLIEKVALKLSGWKARLLTLPGRAILIQSVSEAIPAYVMQCTPLPAKVCDNLDALNRNFLWGSTADKRKLHLVNWQKVTQPKRFGGLGLHSAKVCNIVSMAKLVWRASKDETSLWATVIRHKYLKKLFATGSKKSLGSRTWCGIKKGWPLFSRGSCWAISNGLTTNVWHDKWVGGVTLRSLLIGLLNFTEDSLMVSDILLGNGIVDLTRISFVLPSQLTDSLKAIPLQCWSTSQDTRYWLDSPTGEFNFKSAYQLESNSSGQPSQFAGGKWLWKVSSLPKVKYFIWLCLHNSLFVREVLASRGLNITPLCPRCGTHAESILHLLRDCSASCAFWQKIGIPSRCISSFGVSLYDWLHANCTDQSKKPPHNLPWSILFPIGLWSLWLERNNKVFHSESRPVEKLVDQCLHRALEYFFVVGFDGNSKASESIPVKWVPPALGWVKLNTDGSSLGNPGQAGGGGVIRDHVGHWIRGFTRRVGVATSLAAELWAIRDGLSLIVDMGFLYVTIEIDALMVVSFLALNSIPHPSLRPLVADCRFLLQRIPHKELKHVFREANKCADRLAKLGGSQEADFVVLDTPPACICDVLSFDNSGCISTRSVTRIS